MNYKQVFCPNCNGTINEDLLNLENIYCPYCGQQLYINKEKQIIEITHNINKNISKEEHYIDHARIVESNNQIIRNRDSIYVILAVMLFFALIMAFCFIMYNITK